MIMALSARVCVLDGVRRARKVVGNLDRHRVGLNLPSISRLVPPKAIQWSSRRHEVNRTHVVLHYPRVAGSRERVGVGSDRQQVQ